MKLHEMLIDAFVEFFFTFMGCLKHLLLAKLLLTGKSNFVTKKFHRFCLSHANSY